MTFVTKPQASLTNDNYLLTFIILTNFLLPWKFISCNVATINKTLSNMNLFKDDFQNKYQNFF